MPHNKHSKDHVTYYRVFIKYCVFFPRILESLPPLPRQHSAAIGCTKNYQPIGMTVDLHSVESFEGLLQRCRREGGVAVNGEKTQYLKNTLYYLHIKGFCVISYCHNILYP